MTELSFLANMSLPEKLQLLEAVWDDVCKHPESVQSPEWHREVLAEREKRLENGEATFSSWAGAKKRLLDLRNEH